ncbi:MAG: hypothetical protein GY788_06245 [bacterium]|nr:hypothetical protein [bacterium]
MTDTGATVVLALVLPLLGAVLVAYRGWFEDDVKRALTKPKGFGSHQLRRQATQLDRLRRWTTFFLITTCLLTAIPSWATVIILAGADTSRGPSIPKLLVPILAAMCVANVVLLCQRLRQLRAAKKVVKRRLEGG